MIGAEILKNPHHNGAQSEALLRRIAPIATIISNGAPPSAAYQKRLAKVGSRVYVTCKGGDGDVLVASDGERWSVRMHAIERMGGDAI